VIRWRGTVMTVMARHGWVVVGGLDGQYLRTSVQGDG